MSDPPDDESIRAQLDAANAKLSALEKNLRSSRDVGMAMGILMERHRLSPDRAFLVLRQMSQRRNVQLREVAEVIVRAGESI